MLQLINDIYGIYVKWPTQEEKRQIKHRFWLTSSLDNCIGAVDGTHCSIPGIGKFKQSYVTRKCQYGINITAVCTPSKQISYAVVGAPGSYHDNCVWELNDIFKNSNNYFQNQEYLFGDSAYTLNERMMTPYIGNVDQNKRNFNFKHSQGRIIIENTFGLLKCRIKIMGQQMKCMKLSKCVLVSKACITVHNIIIEYDKLCNLETNFEIEEDDLYISDWNEMQQLNQHGPSVTGVSITGHSRRERLHSTYQ
eukprot:NODE_591_length_5620_cov_0.949828.p1 type:complete len:251 gc:universal NODE_591_length_5620_cov_0.949828:4276-5028(+)